MYSTFISKSRYSRFLDEKQRRENWSETVDRYLDFMTQHLLTECHYHLEPKLRNDLFDAIFRYEVMPSMRAIMTSGDALKRDNTCGFNCSYIPIDHPRAFDEILFILMNGTGLGHSCEKKYVNQLPIVPLLHDSTDLIVVKDNKEGWATGFRELISFLYSGFIPKYDLSLIRKAGTRLRVFGGRASGSEPLDDLFRFTIDKFKSAQGRKLKTIECHDIICMIAQIVVVGGVRRSALISLSDLDDDDMRFAKTGDWWIHHPYRALANISAVYNSTPNIGDFMKEWISLYDSKSGERGIFNRQASFEHIKKNQRRDPNFEWGLNPCAEIILRPNQFCNLSEVVIRQHDSLDSLIQKVRLATILGTFQSTLTYFPYLRDIWTKNTKEERLLGVSLTGILDNPFMGIVNDDTTIILQKLKKIAIDTNLDLSSKLGIPHSTAITCIKPSGTVSQLCDCASGIHPRFAKYYIRRVRSNIKEPITNFMIQKGIPCEDCHLSQDTKIFSFPMKSPDHAIIRKDLSAIQHLEIWLMYYRYWCEHKPSVTISVQEHEWLDVGAWVYKHFHEMSGVAFLPYDGGNYQQAPYEEIDEKTYYTLSQNMPTDINFDEFKEDDDNVEGSQLLCCMAGECSL